MTLFRNLEQAFLDQIEVLLNVTLKLLLILKPVKNLRCLKNLEFVFTFGALVLVQEFDHESVMMELDQTEHVV